MKKQQLYKIYTKNGCKCDDHPRLQDATNLVSHVIAKRKGYNNNIIASKLNNPKTSAKTYWSIFKIFCNGKKIPFAPSLLDNELV